MGNIKRKIEKINRVFRFPLLLLAGAILLAGCVILWHYNFYLHNSDPNVRSLTDLISNSLLALLATGAGIFVPISIQRNLQREDQRKAMLFALTAVWSELRSSKSILINIKKNFKFSDTLHAPKTEHSIDEKIELIAMKLGSFSPMCNSFCRVAYESMLNSGTMTYLNSDEIYNIVNQTYDDLEDFCTMYSITLAGINLRNKSTQLMKKKGLSFEKTPFEKAFYVELEVNLKKLYSYLIFMEKEVEQSIQELYTFIKSFGPNLEEQDKKITNQINLP